MSDPKSTIPTATDIVAALLAKVSDLERRVVTAEAAAVALVPRVAQPAYEDKYAPWEEQIMVRALRDCTYPDPNDPEQYAKFRRGRTEEHAGDVFPLMLRSHLTGADHLEELVGAEKPVLPAKRIPQTAARGVKVQPTGY